MRSRSPGRATAPSASVGPAVLLSASRVLRAFYDNKHAQAFEGKLAALRIKIRETEAAILAAKSAKHYAWGINGLMELKTEYGPYWCETPDEALAFYKEQLARIIASSTTADGRLFYRRDTTYGERREPPLRLISWKDNDLSLDLKWDAFVRALCSSVEPEEAMFGLFFRIADCQDPQKREVLVTDALQIMWDHREALLKRNKVGIYFDCLYRANSLGKDLWRFSEVLTPYLKYYLDETKIHDDWPVFLRLWWPHKFSEKEATEIYKSYLGYKKRSGTELSPAFRSFLAEKEDELLRRFPSLIADDHRSVLNVTQFWRPHDHHDGVRQGVWAEDKLWLIGKYNDVSRLYCIDLESFQSTVIEIPYGIQTSGAGIHVTETEIYVGIEKGIAAYNRSNKQWRVLKLPVKECSSFVVSDNHLYLGYSKEASDGNDSGILDVNLADGAVKVLSSSRRRPARNHFDDCEPYGIDSIFIGPGGILGANFWANLKGNNQRCYLFDKRSLQWEPFKAGKYPFVNASYGKHILFYSYLWHFFAATLQNQELEFLMVNPDFKDCAPAIQGNAIWDVPDDLSEDPKVAYRNSGKNLAAYDGNRLSVFCNKSEATGWLYTLKCFEKNLGRKHVNIPLKFTLKPEDRASLQAHGMGNLPWIENPFPGLSGEGLKQTGKGLIMIHSWGVWFIPNQDLQTYIDGLKSAKPVSAVPMIKEEKTTKPDTAVK